MLPLALVRTPLLAASVCRLHARRQGARFMGPVGVHLPAVPAVLVLRWGSTGCAGDGSVGHSHTPPPSDTSAVPADPPRLDQFEVERELGKLRASVKAALASGNLEVSCTPWGIAAAFCDRC